MKKLMMIIALGVMASSALASYVELQNAWGSLSDGSYWVGGVVPSGSTTGRVTSVNSNVWTGQGWENVAVRQEGAYVTSAPQSGGASGDGDLALRGGTAGSGITTIYEIEDARTDYASYTNLNISGRLTMWSRYSEKMELSVLSGHVELGELDINTRKDGVLKGTINMRDGILHAATLVKSIGNVNMLAGGTGEIVVDVLDAELGGNLFLNFETGNRGSFMLGQKADGSTTAGIWNFLITHNQVSIDGVTETDTAKFKVTTVGLSSTLELVPVPEPEVPGKVPHPFTAEIATVEGQTSVSFQWLGQGGVGYMLEESPDVFFTNNVHARYFLGEGGTVSAGHPLPPEMDSGFWRVFEITGSNGVTVAKSGAFAGKLVRYDDAGNPELLHAFGVNYYDAFLRYILNGSDTSFVQGFEYLQNHHIPVARVLAAGFWPSQWNLYFTDKAEYFQRLDYLVAQAEQHNIGLVLDCFWSFATLGELVDDAVAAGLLVPGVDFVPPNPLNVDVNGDPTYAEYTRALGRPDSGSNALLALYTRELVERYGQSPAIWAWEFGNEYNNRIHPNFLAMRDRPAGVDQGMMLPNTSMDTGVLPPWTGPDDLILADVEVAKTLFAQTVRAVDTWRLIMSGDSRPRSSAYHNWTEHTWTLDSRAELAQVIPVDNPSPMDTVTVHIYPGKPGEDPEVYFTDNPVTIQWETGEYKELLDYFVAKSAAIGRPLVVGEWGAIGDGTTQDEKNTFQRFAQALVDSGVQLSLLWDFDNQNAGQSEEWHVNPGTAKEYQLTNPDVNLWDLEQLNLHFQN